MDLSESEIEAKLRALLLQERRITNEILLLINEVEARKLHLKRGYSSVFDFLTKGFGYSSSAAYRRLEAARVLRDAPEVREKLETGTVSLSSLAKARSAVRRYERLTGKKTPVADVVEAIENKTGDAVDQGLFEIFPELAAAPSESRRAVAADRVRLHFDLDREAMADFEWIKSYLSHSIPAGEMSAIFSRLLREYRDRHDPDRKRGRRKPTSAAAAGRVNDAEARRLAKLKAEGRCEYVDPETGRRCNSRHQLQIDHIIPRALGGADHPDNYRCLCRQHNLFMAELSLGEEAANCWRSPPPDG